MVQGFRAYKNSGFSRIAITEFPGLPIAIAMAKVAALGVPVLRVAFCTYRSVNSQGIRPQTDQPRVCTFPYLLRSPGVRNAFNEPTGRDYQP